MINAFLSYRHKNDSSILARNELKDLCAKTGEIKLIYDVDVTVEDDSLIAFMEDLVGSRCVFVFLDPDYFESSYTLFELISINEQDELDKRFVHPVRVTDRMSTYERTTAKQYWLDNEKIRNETARLLVKTGRLKATEQNDHDALWSRIDSAWSNLIEDPLDHLKGAAIKDGRPTQTLQGCVDKVVPAINDVKQDQLKDLRDHIKVQITALLNKNTIPLGDLVDELNDPKGNVRKDSANIADHITHDKFLVIDTLAALINVMDAQKTTLGLESTEWESCFYDGEAIAGWLLLLSVDNDWWFEHKHPLVTSLKERMLDQFPLESKEYAEVVISRSLKQQAKFRVNKHGVIEPDNQKHKALMIYDGCSEGAKETQFLIDIYKDLYGKDPHGELSPSALLDLVLRRARNHKRNARGKAIYYLVSKETKAMLEGFDWYKESKERSDGCLHFIYCDVSNKPYEKSVSSEDQQDLLDQVAILLSLNEEQEA